MNTFEEIKGYDSLKEELNQVIDIIKHPEVYEELGVTCPKGILLFGKPGLGKTLIANSFIEACNREAIICRKNAANQSFVDSIVDSFDKALEMAPSIILLDDMDKFSNDDEDHKDSEAYVTIQTCIDLIKGSNVIVIATANNIDKLPESLIRTGRFDKKFNVKAPNETESKLIIEHYLSKKELGSSVDVDLAANLLKGNSCSTLETVINQAGIYAGLRRSRKVEMDDLIKSYLTIVREIPESEIKSDSPKDLYVNDGTTDVYWHEAAHIVINELINPGSVVFGFGVSKGTTCHGFTLCDCAKQQLNGVDRLKSRIKVSLASTAAIDIIFGRVDFGARKDIYEALRDLHNCLDDLGGFAGLGLATFSCASDSHDAIMEAVEAQIAELYLQEAKEMLCANRQFLEEVAKALSEKNVLLSKDIAKIRTACSVN